MLQLWQLISWWHAHLISTFSLTPSLLNAHTHKHTHTHTCAYTFLFSFCVPGPTFLSSGISWRELDINYTNHKQISWQMRRERREGKCRNERLRSHFAPFKFIERVRKEREKEWERREKAKEGMVKKVQDTQKLWFWSWIGFILNLWRTVGKSKSEWRQKLAWNWQNFSPRLKKLPINTKL